MIAVVIPVMVPIAVMAACPRVFQITTLVLCLAAMVTVLALGVMQLSFGFADLLFALSVIIVIAVKRPRGNHSAQE